MVSRPAFRPMTRQLCESPAAVLQKDPGYDPTPSLAHLPHRPGNASDTSAPEESNLEPHSGQHGVEGSQAVQSAVPTSCSPGEWQTWADSTFSTTFSFTVLGSLEGKNLPAIGGDMRDSSWIPGSGRSPGGGHGNPLQYSCLENPMDRGACRAAVHWVTKSWTRLSNLTTTTK